MCVCFPRHLLSPSRRSHLLKPTFFDIISQSACDAHRWFLSILSSVSSHSATAHTSDTVKHRSSRTRSNTPSLSQPVSNRTLCFSHWSWLLPQSSPPAHLSSTPSHINDNLLHDVFTRPEMNRAIIISHVNSADNDQKPSPAPLSRSPLLSPPALGSEQRWQTSPFIISWPV